MSKYIKKVGTFRTRAKKMNGEEYEVNASRNILTKERENYTIFSANISSLLPQLSKADFLLLHWIGFNLEYDKGIIPLSNHYKKQIHEWSGLGLSTINRSIGKLQSLSILVPVEFKDRDRHTMYHANPNYLWKGGSIARNKALRVVLEKLAYLKLPQKERQERDDIDRYAAYHSERKSNETIYDFALVNPAMAHDEI